MFRRFMTVFALFHLFILLPLSVSAQEPVIITLEHADESLSQIMSGQTFVLDVVVNSPHDLFSGEVTISYNPNLLEVLEVIDGDLFTSGFSLANNTNNISGQVRYGYSLLGNAEQVKNGTFVSLRFSALVNGEARIGITSASFTTVGIDETTGIPTGSTPYPTEYGELLLTIGDATTGEVENTATTVPESTTIESTLDTSTETVPTAVETVVPSATSDLIIQTPPESPPITDNPIFMLVLGIMVISFVLFVILTIRYFQQQHKPAHARLITQDSRVAKRPLLLRHPRTIIARQKIRTANLIINDNRISNPHLMIIQHENKYFVKDLDSKNGTFLLDLTSGEFMQLVKDQYYRLHSGDRLRFGQKLIFEFQLLPLNLHETYHEGNLTAPFETRIESVQDTADNIE